MIPMLEEYFRRKIAQKIVFSVRTGNRSYMREPPFERVYSAEILSVEERGVSILLSSYDKTPSGLAIAESSHYWGELTVSRGNSQTMMGFWRFILEVKNPSLVPFIRTDTEENTK